MLFAVHFFACAFWSVASDSRTPEEIEALLSGKHVPADVSKPLTQPRRVPCALNYARSPLSRSSFLPFSASFLWRVLASNATHLHLPNQCTLPFDCHTLILV